MFTITDSAKKKILDVMKAQNQTGKALRLRVDYVGNPRLQYDLTFEDEANKLITDTVVDAGDFKILIDPLSTRFMDGGTVDYQESLAGGTFNITSPAVGHETAANLDTPEAMAVQKLLDEQINPAIAGHGGSITMVDLKDNVLYVTMGGGCHGCGMANATLRQGVEYMIKESIPSVREVVDVTDHATGENPYIPGSY